MIMMAEGASVASAWNWAEQEIATIPFKDQRVRKSLAKNLDRILKGCGRSFSDRCGPAGRQAARRLFRTKGFTEEVVLTGHIHQIQQRIKELDALPQDNKQEGQTKALVLGIQDSTQIELTTHVKMEGIGPLSGGRKRGLMMHNGFLVSAEGIPLGVPYSDIWARDLDKVGIKEQRASRPTQEKESYKWIEGLTGIEAALEPDQPLLLIQDREADLYDFLAAPRRSQTQLLVRCSHPRKVEVEEKELKTEGPKEKGLKMSRKGDKPPTLFDAIAQVPVCATHQIEVSRQSATSGKNAKKAHEARVATVELRYAPVVIQATSTATLYGKSVPSLTLSVVQVSEVGSTALTDKQVDALAAEKDPFKPILWTLLCTEPVTSAEQAWQMVQYYKLRWLIERFHFVLKSGCGAEEMQFDDAATAKKVLALYSLVSWRLLWLMHTVRSAPDAAASSMLDEVSFQTLKAMTKRRISTANDVLIAIGTLGGYSYYPKNPDPGIKSLWRGLRRLDDMVLAFQAGRDNAKI